MDTGWSLVEYTRNCEIKSGIEFPDNMQRIALGVEYQGAGYNGFQKQATSPLTIQAEVERALTRIADESITVVCAGRTDAGVNASEQVLHFDTLAQRPAKAWVQGGNTQLPDDIRIHWARSVGPRFHARFSAKSRTYRYVLYRSPTRSACLGKSITWTRYDLDVGRMQRAAEHLLGEHDFTSFRASQCQARSPVRTIESIHLTVRGVFIVLEIRANAFLHHMVRNIMGALIEIGRGAKPEDWTAELLAVRDRSQAAPTARPWGLYFVRAHYPEVYGLPENPLGPLFLQT